MSSSYNFTSAQKKNVQLLDKYRCRVCEKWKEPSSFSNNELEKFTSKAVRGSALNGVNAKLRCRGCSGGAVTEKQCEGPCKQWKDLQQFSKSSRSSGGNQLSQEPGVVTTAPPTGDDGEGDDSDDGDWNGTYSDPEAGESGSDYEDYSRPATSVTTHVPAPAPGIRQPSTVGSSSVGPRQHILVPYNALTSMSINDTSNAGTGHTMDTAKISAPTMSGARIPSGSAVPSGSGIGARHIPSQAQSETSSVSNPYENSSVNQGPVWGALDARRRPGGTAAPVKFSAWDNEGQKHSQAKPMTTSSSSTATAPVSSVPRTSNFNWERPVGSRQPAQNATPANAAPAATTPRPTQTFYQPSEDGSEDLYGM
ncbi:hypothetical protein VTL71DRAFT_12629 [Oculimacula yallundae]|uniref:Stc1 domain-containing protein n=1 Tax=Oculimacula yallundae TaxID=86028 RepID=A0ABR4CN17_9HELO